MVNWYYSFEKEVTKKIQMITNTSILIIDTADAVWVDQERGM